MKKAEFMTKHNFNDLDFRNLERYEQVRARGEMNMFQYLGMMKVHNINGGSKLANWILTGDNYSEFLDVERNK